MIDVTVVGSLHLDIMVAAPRLPGRDETLMGSSWRYKCGGKGGNQAVAAARCGARTAFGGATGDDDFGKRLRSNLEVAGIDTRYVLTDATRGSGMSVAIEEAGGEYGAVVVSGANAGLDAAAAVREWEPLWACKVLLLQNEIPESVNIAAARAAKASSAKVVLNAAPARAMPDDLLSLVDVLVVNRVEAAMLTGSAVDTVAQANQAASNLSRGTRAVIVTLGRHGVVLKTRQGEMAHIAAIPVTVISSHGAGDCFCGALAASLARGNALHEACSHANEVAAAFISQAKG